MAPRILQINRIVLNVVDSARAAGFYAQALGFEHVSSSGKTVLLRLGDQEIELVTSSGQSYPQPRAANDPWFQHFAIAVSDMEAAYAQLQRFGAEPISIGGPELLPPSTGSVTAYKFRDPDGHPLELSYIPGSDWLTKPQKPGPFLGIDHTALSAPDLEASTAFYQSLGMTVAGRYLNQGPEQDRLDGLESVQLDITALAPSNGGPHIELLHYRRPQGATPVPLDSCDIASTLTVLEADRTGSDVGLTTDLCDPAEHRLRAPNGLACASR